MARTALLDQATPLRLALRPRSWADGQGRRLLSAESIRLLTMNHLTPRQLADAGPFPLTGRGWGYGMTLHHIGITNNATYTRRHPADAEPVGLAAAR